MENLNSYQTVRRTIEETLKASGIIESPQLIAVSKFQEAEKLVQLYRQGQRLFGENYVQELIEKKLQLELLQICDVDFHFIGKLQTNKVKHLLPHVRTLHSIDSLRLLKEVDKQASTLQKKIQVYLQVNIDDEASKSGFKREDLDQIFKSTEWSQLRASKWIEVIGWMTIPNPERDSFQAFQQMREISKKYQDQVGLKLSMGMSEDYVEAIRAGATALRIGSAIFGPRG